MEVYEQRKREGLLTQREVDVIDAVTNMWDDDQWVETVLDMPIVKVHRIYDAGIKSGMISEIKKEEV